MTNTNRLFKWCLDVARGKVRRHNVTVVMYDVKGTELHRWNFINAYPVKWVGPQLNGGQGAVAIETIELAHEGLDHA
jgi:phage tail-like protein